jgi:hypothetical protein
MATCPNTTSRQTPANPFQNLQEQITVSLVPEKRATWVTTERQKVQVVASAKSV